MKIYVNQFDNINPKISKSVPGYTLGLHEHFIRSNKDPIYIQCPPCRIISKFNNSVVILFSVADIFVNSFGTRLNKFCNKIIDKVNIKYNQNIKWSLFQINSIDKKFSISCNLESFINIYDENYKKYDKSIDELMNEDYIECIIEISKVRLIYSSLFDSQDENISGKILFKIVQIRIPKPKNIELKFKETSNKIEISENSFGKHNLYSKYYKMKNHGIPIQAVKQKMEIDGFDSNIIEKYNENDEVPNNLKNINNKFSLESSLKNQSKLLQVTEIQQNNTKLIKKTHNISITDILNKLDNLRKTGFNLIF